MGVASILLDSVVSGDLCGAKRLDLAFGDKVLRYICESDVKARKEIGKAAASALHARLADLEAADAITDLEWVAMDVGPEVVSIEFHPEYRLIVEANEANPPLRGNGINWDKVDRLLLKRIERA